MTIYNAYMKIIRRNGWLILLYLVIFFGITMLYQVMAEGEEYTDYQAESIRLALIDEDGGELANAFQAYLGQFHEITLMENDTSALQEKLFYRDIEYIVRIPADFFETCAVDGKTIKVTKVPGSYTAFYVDQQVNSFLNNARTYYAAGFSEEEAAKALNEVQPAQVTMLHVNENAGEMPVFAFYFRYMPYLFLSVLCYVMGYVLFAFREGDLPKRMSASAVPVFRQNLEGLLSALTVGAGLWGFSILAAVFFYGDSFTSSGVFFYYLLNSAMLLLVSLALSYLVGIFTKNSSTLSGIVNTLSLGMCFLCGVFVPLELMNKNVVKAAQFLPVYWYEKVNDILGEFGTVTGEMKTAVWQMLGIQFVFAAALVCVALAVSKIQKEGLHGSIFS